MDGLVEALERIKKFKGNMDCLKVMKLLIKPSTHTTRLKRKECDMARINNKVSEKLYQLCQEIEKLPASEQATKCVTLCSEILETVDSLNDIKNVL